MPHIHTPNWGIELETISCTGQCPSNWATPARDSDDFLYQNPGNFIFLFPVFTLLLPGSHIFPFLGFSHIYCALKELPRGNRILEVKFLCLFFLLPLLLSFWILNSKQNYFLQNSESIVMLKQSDYTVIILFICFFKVLYRWFLRLFCFPVFFCHF